MRAICDDLGRVCNQPAQDIAVLSNLPQLPRLAQLSIRIFMLVNLS